MATATNSRNVRPVKALSHAIDVLEALASQDAMGVTELSREIGLSKTAVYNILATFESRRLVNRDPATSQYRLGWRVYELGTEVLRHNELGPLAHPLLKDLARRTGETVLLAILDGAGVTYVGRVESSRRIRMVAAPGRQARLHSTASGKVLLAYQPAAFVDQVLAQELEAFTPATITNPEKLRAELRDVRKKGYAVCIHENEAELASMAVPVSDYSGQVGAALTVAAPAARFGKQAQREVLPALREVAGELATLTGARDSSAAAIA